MTDDTVFDAREFAHIVTAAVGDGRTSAELALRNAGVVSRATRALLAFARAGPDEISAYVIYAPGCPQLFAALRAVGVRAGVAEAALDCLLAVARFAANGKGDAVEAARGVVKDVVKGRVGVMVEVFRGDRRGCARKALILLGMVADSSPILAKEVVNRLELASDRMAPVLCSRTNDFCRVPFLRLVAALLSAGDHDVVWCLATRAREVLVACVKVIAGKAQKDALQSVSAFAKDAGKTGKGGKGRSNANVKDRVSNPAMTELTELLASIKLLRCLYKYVLSCPNDSIARSAFESPVLESIATIAASEMPLIAAESRDLAAQHTALRLAARDLFTAIASNSRVSRASLVARALIGNSVTDSAAALAFVLHVVNACPRVSRPLLQYGPYVTSQPRLSSAWLAHAAVIAACVPRLRSATPLFRQHRFFEKTLGQPADGLVQHFGVLIAASFCEVVRRDPVAVVCASDYLPALSVIDQLLKKGTGDKMVHGLLASYQSLFGKEFEETKMDAIRISIGAAGEDLAVVERTVRACLHSSPRNALSTLFHKKLFSALLSHACQTKSAKSGSAIWLLLRDVLLATNLFQRGTEYEADVWLSVLSTTGSDSKACATAFEAVACVAWENPYGLFDEISEAQRDGIGGDKRKHYEPLYVSLLSVAAARRLCKVAEQRNQGTSESLPPSVFEQVLVQALSTITACRHMMGFSIGADPISKRLVLALDAENVWWMLKHKNDTVTQSARARIVGLSRASTYPNMRGLFAIRLLAHLRVPALDASRTSGGDALPLGTLWDALCCAEEGPHAITVPTSAFQGFVEQKGQRRHHVSITVLLGRILRNAFVSSLDSNESLAAAILDAATEPQEQAFVTAFLLRASSSVIRAQLQLGLLETATKFLAASDTSVESDETGLAKFLFDSILIHVRSSAHVTEAAVSLLVCYAMDSLMVNQEMALACAVFDALLHHRDSGTAVCSRMALERRTHDLTFRLPASLRLTNSVTIVRVLRSLPRLRSLAVDAIIALDGDGHKSSWPGGLTIVAELTSRGSGDEQDMSQVEKERMFACVLDAAASATSVDAPESFHLTAACQVGQHVADGCSDFEALFDLLVRRWQRVDGEGLASSDLWPLTQGVLARYNAEGNLQAASERIANLLTQLAVLCTEWFAEMPADLVLPMNVLCCSVQAVSSLVHSVRVRKISLYAHCSDVDSFEKSLTSFCSALLKRAHGVTCRDLTSDDTRGRDALEGDLFSTLADIFTCVSEVLSLDLVLDKASKRGLHALGKSEGQLVAVCCGGSMQSGGVISHEQLHAVLALASFVNAACARLPRFSMEEETGRALCFVEQAMSSSACGYSASLSPFDEAVRLCMCTIQEYLKASSARQTHSLPDHRSRYFSVNVFDVVAMLDPQRLDVTCDAILAQNSDSTSCAGPQNVLDILAKFKTSSQPLHSVEACAAYDPKLLLIILRRAAIEASRSPKVALLDLGRVVSEGLFAVAVTGMASKNEEIRTSAYAALAAFGDVVGPESGVARDAAAALYRDRRQLALMLTILRESIQDPLTPVLPLFATWFRRVVSIVLRPSHPAYNPVTRYLSRSPVLDVGDCLGVANLLRCDAAGPELRASRLLALEILERGIWSRHDHVAARRRKLYDAVLMLAGSSCGIDETVQSAALRVLAIIPERSATGQVAYEFVRTHGLVPWLAPQAADAVENGVKQLMLRLKVLASTARNFTAGEDQLRHASSFSRTLTLLVGGFRRTGRGNDLSAEVVDCILETARAVCGLAPNRRRLLTLDMPLLRNAIASLGGDAEKERNEAFLFILARSADVYVSALQIKQLLCLSDECGDNPSNLSISRLANRSMAEAFVAEAILVCGCGLTSTSVGTQSVCHWTASETSSVCLAVARALQQSSPSVWLIASAAALFRGSPALPNVVETVAGQISSGPPETLAAASTYQWGPQGEALKLDLISALVDLSRELRICKPEPSCRAKGTISVSHLKRHTPSPFENRKSSGKKRRVGPL